MEFQSDDELVQGTELVSGRGKMRIPAGVNPKSFPQAVSKVISTSSTHSRMLMLRTTPAAEHLRVGLEVEWRQ